MNTLMCNELNNGNHAAAAHARVDVRPALVSAASNGIAFSARTTTSWTFVTKPYAYQRPSGAPPG